MASRPKRGKYMPLPPPKIAQRQQQMKEQEQKQEEETSEEEDDDENNEEVDDGEQEDSSDDGDEEDSSAEEDENDNENENNDEEVEEEEDFDEDFDDDDLDLDAPLIQMEGAEPEMGQEEEFVLVEGIIELEESGSESEMADEEKRKRRLLKRKKLAEAGSATQEGGDASASAQDANQPKSKRARILAARKRAALLAARKQQILKRKAAAAAAASQEDVEEDFRPPPTPRVPPKGRRDREDTPIDIRDPQDFGQIYTELIDDCQSLEAETGNDENFQHAMSRNIQRGQALFEHLMKGALGPPTGEPGRRTVGGPGEMYLAYLHTKISSNIIRNRAERIGSGTSIFSVEEFLDKLKQEYLDKEDNIYDAKRAAAEISMETAKGTKALMPLVAVVGTFDRDAVVIPKPKKVRQPIRKQIQEETQETGQDDSTVDNSMALVQQNPGAENRAKEMNKILKHLYKETSDPVNLFEFILDRSSFPRTVENIFNLSFLVKDGHVSVNKEENGKFKDLSLGIKPEKSSKLETSSPDEEQQARNQTTRQKYILSFSPRMWKQMCQMSQGEDTLTHFQRMMEQMQGGQGEGRKAQRGLPAIKF